MIRHLVVPIDHGTLMCGRNVDKVSGRTYPVSLNDDKGTLPHGTFWATLDPAHCTCGTCRSVLAAFPVRLGFPLS